MRQFCKLCGKKAEIRNSHIIPEFYYKPLYDDPHRFFELSTNELIKTKYLQKGLSERLLCDDCEQKFSKYEHYVSNIFKSPNLKNLTNDIFEFDNISYKKLRLFQLSILWRIGVSQHKTFCNLSLGEHEKIIREMLIKENPGDYFEYGCFMVLLLINNRPFSEIIIQPELINLNEKKFIRIIFGGFIWMFSLNRIKGNIGEDFLINKSGKLRIKKRNAETLKILKKYADELSIAGKLND